MPPLLVQLLRLEKLRGLLTIIDETIGERPGISQSYMEKHNIKVVDIWRTFEKLPYGIEHCKIISLQGYNNIGALCFSGSDPGIKTMSVTSFIMKDRLDFHKALHDGEEVEQYTKFLEMPAMKTLTSKEVWHRSLLYQARWKLTKAKLHSVCYIFQFDHQARHSYSTSVNQLEGQHVAATEDRLKKYARENYEEFS